MTRVRFLFGLLLASGLAVPAHAQTAAFAATGAAFPLGNPPFTLGYAFTLSEAFTASGLGLFDQGDDGLAARHEIGLWDAGGTLLASATAFGTTGTLSDGFRYTDITPLLLGSGTYTIGATYLDSLDGIIPNATITPLAGVTFGGARFTAGATLANPTTASGEQGYFGPNLLLTPTGVPEPATWALLLLGFGAAASALRAAPRRRTVTVTYA